MFQEPINIEKKNATKSKPIEKCCNWDYQNFPKSSDFLFKKSGVCDQNFPFYIYISYFCKFSHQKKKTCHHMKI